MAPFIFLSVTEWLRFKSIFGETSVPRLKWKEMKRKKEVELQVQPRVPGARSCTCGVAEALARGPGPRFSSQQDPSLPGAS